MQVALYRLSTLYLWIYVNAYLQVITISENEAMNLKESRGFDIGGFRGRKGKGKCCIIIWKIKYTEEGIEENMVERCPHNRILAELIL